MYQWLVFSILALMFMFSYFVRLSTGVLGPELMEDLQMTASQLGALGAAFFYAFAIVQIPVGLALDFMNPKRVIISTTFLAAVGCLLFSIAESFQIALVGRILIGLGMSAVYMGSLKIFNNWFRPDEFGFVSGLMLSIGNIGALVAATPLVFIASTVGWRNCFRIFGIFVICMIVLICLIVKNYPQDTPQHSSVQPIRRGEIFKSFFSALTLVFSDKNFWLIAISSSIRYGSLISIQGFLGTLYLIDVLGYSPQKAGNILSMISVGYLIGAPAAGRLSDTVFRSRKRVTLISLLLFAVSILSLLREDAESEIFWFSTFFGLGFFSSVGGVSFAHVKELFPREIAGIALTGNNFFTILGVAMGQHVLGIIIGSFSKIDSGYPTEAYHLAFIVLFIGSIIAFVSYSIVKDTNPLDYPKTV